MWHQETNMSQVHRLAIAAEKYDGIVFMDMDGNILSEQFTEEGDDATHMESDNNQLPSEIGAIEEYTEGHTDQQPKATEAIEDKTVSTTDDKNGMNEVDERT